MCIELSMSRPTEGNNGAILGSRSTTCPLQSMPYNHAYYSLVGE